MIVGSIATAVVLLVADRRTRPLDLSLLPMVVMGVKGKKQHGLVAFERDFTSCKCGWHFLEPKPDDFAPNALKDHLLDRYNAHRAQRAQLGEGEAHA